MGVDTGLAATGFGLIAMGSGGTILYRGSGVIRSPSTFSFPQRIQRIYRRLAEEIKNYTPHLMAVEQPFFAKNVKSAMLLGQARGLAILAAAEAGIEVHEYSPLEVKQAVVGYGRAAKEQVQAMISSLLHVPKDLKADAADALAVAICLAHSYSWKNSLRRLTALQSPAGPRGRNRNEAWVEGRG
jgi:crossover junction endodeoxyribonuclease RuvC